VVFFPSESPSTAADPLHVKPFQRVDRAALVAQVTRGRFASKDLEMVPAFWQLSLALNDEIPFTQSVGTFSPFFCER